MSNVDVRRDERQSPGNPPDNHDPVPGAVDWILGILAGIVGLGLTAVGVGLYTQVDRAMIREAVLEEEVEPNGLTQLELIDAAGPFVDALAVGLGVSGIALVGVAAVYVYARRQTRRRISREGGTTATFAACTVYGAAAGSLVSSIIPGLGALVGGAIGANLYDGDSSVRVGAATGLLSFAVTLPLLVSLGVGVVAGGAAIGELGGGAAIAGIIVVSGLVGAAFNAGVGALGGFLADRFA
jgi:hypothetical protein